MSNSVFDPNLPLNIGVDINMNDNKIVNIGVPVNPKDAVNKNYVDAAIASGSGGSSSGKINWFDISQDCGGSTSYLTTHDNIPSINPIPFSYPNNESYPISITFFVKVGSTPSNISYNVNMNNNNNIFTFTISGGNSNSILPATGVSSGTLVTWSMTIPGGFNAVVRLSDSINAAYSIM